MLQFVSFLYSLLCLFTFQEMKVVLFVAVVFHKNLNVEKPVCSCVSDSTAPAESSIKIQIWIWESKSKSVGGEAIWLHCPLSLVSFFGRLALNNQLNLDGIEKLLYRLLISTASRPAKSQTLRKRHLSDFSHSVPCIFRKQVMHLQLYFWDPQFLFCFVIPCARQTQAAWSVICQSAIVWAMGNHGVGEQLLHWAAL